MRNAPNVYLSSLALVAVPNIVGNYLGPLAVLVMTVLRLQQKKGQGMDSAVKDADPLTNHAVDDQH